MNMDSYDGLGKNRKFGFDKEDGPNKRAIDIDSILEKLETQLKKKPERDILVKCQNILDKLADKYNGKCTKKQLSRMYKIQGKIYEYTGEKKLAKNYKNQAQEARKNHELRRNLFITFVIVGVLGAIFAYFAEQSATEARTKEKIEKCIDIAYASALDVKNGISAEYEELREYEYSKVSLESSIKCYEEYKTSDSEKHIKELKELLQAAETDYLNYKRQLEKDSDYLKQYMLEKEKNNIHCNTTYNGYSADTNCY